MKKIVAGALLPVVLLLSINNCVAQINPKKILEKKVNKAINKQPEKPVDSSAVKKENEAQKKNNEPAITNAPRDTVAPNQEPALEAYSKYDFIPGEKVVFFEDFSQDNIGDFPAAWNTNGSGEIVNTNLFPGRWLRFTGRNAVWTDQLLKLPDNYTIEFDIIPIQGTEGGMAGYNFRLLQSINAKAYDHGSIPGKAGFLLSLEYFGRTSYRTYINDKEGEGLGLTGFTEDKSLYQSQNHKYHIAIWMQKARIRVYQDEHKLFDLPRAFPVASVKMDRIRFEEGAGLVTNIRIAAGAPDLRNKLLTVGKIVSYGIYFDVNKDIVKPESYASVKEIALLMNENPGIRIKVVGHTDADGTDAANLDLSKRRAANIKNELVKSFGIDPSRIDTDGKGETEPIAPNDTPSNKALNRRVEFIKL